ncbi:FAD-dependent oxidoreductase [Streptomyces sp. SID486]|uniref:NAD(P)/FAD-dependent oxidoreductase n=1 Tax=Streptomyces sp. SID486 TaxID=2690264 RepID=UPI0013699D5E|nr:FAD-dependent oxidoreductase [Streptomyces sp. SID486]MYX95023.1 FAD-dependent oxidoreductase [Streptomyces sp. SID486]
MTSTLIVIGHGMVGHRLVDTLRALDRTRRWRVIVLGEEGEPAYDRVRLSAYLGCRSRARLSLASREFLTDPRIEVRPGVAAVHVDRRARTVRTADGDVIGYDALVLATGSRPFVPPVPGRDLGNCFVQRTLDDADALRAAVRPGRPAVVVGGGLLGLEAAQGVQLLGMRPHLVEAAPHLMPAQLDAEAAHVLRDGAARLGMGLHCGTTVASVDAGADGTVRSVTLGDGTVLDAELVVFAAGVRPRDDLSIDPALRLGDRGGFLTDALCRTADDRIWAVGECAALLGRCHGLVAPGYRMAESVARQLTGHPTEPPGDMDTSTELKLLGVHVATFGSTSGEAGTAAEMTFREGTSRYAKVFLRPDTGTLLGGILAGETGSRADLAALVGRPPTPDLERVLFPDPPLP